MEDLNFEQMLIVEEYRKKFEHCCKYNPAKGGQLLNEQLVPAKWDELKHAMEQDSELRTFLTTPAKDLPDNYKLLIDEVSPGIESITLLHLIGISLGKKNFGNITPFFSKSGSKIVGFAAYTSNNNEVNDIKMFSFDPSRGGGSTLVWDLNNLLKKLTQEYNKVSWGAMPQNPANAIYKKAIEHYGGKVEQDGNMIRYTIEKNIGDD